MARGARLVKVSDEDLHALRPVEPVPVLARSLLVGATELVIVTHGAAGATAYRADSTVEVAAPRVDVVDTVGAGDAFMAAVLAVLVDWEITVAGPGAVSALDDDHVRQMLSGATAAASLTCSRRGADPPRRVELHPTWPAA